jgi:phage-related protein
VLPAPGPAPGRLPDLPGPNRRRAHRLETDRHDRGRAAREIRVCSETGAYRGFYVATIGDAIYVLHCFQKKTQRTAKADIDLGKARYKTMRALIEETKP